MHNHIPLRISFSKRPPVTLSTSSHIIQSKSILRINYCKAQAQPIFPSVTIRYNEIESQNKIEGSRISNRSQRLSVVSKEIKDSNSMKSQQAGLQDYLDMEREEVNSNKSIRISHNGNKDLVLKIEDTSFNNKQKETQSNKLYSLPNHIQVEPLIQSITCNFLPCNQSIVHNQVEQDPLVEYRSSRSDKTMSNLNKSLHSDTHPLATRPNPTNSFSASKNCSQGRLQHKQGKLIIETQQTLSSIDIPTHIIGHWQTVLSSGGQEFSDGRSIEIAPFRLNQV